jgi:Xaa-Pro aminopeptidase
VKDPAEVARIEAAARIADAALAAVAPSLADAPTEIEVAVELEAAMRRLGAEEPAFDTIVASGPNGALPHHHPSTRRIGPGELVVIDMGATVDGYRSDMTRTVAVGDLDDTARRLLQVVAAAQAAGLDAVADGVACRDVDAAARRVIEAAGWGEAFVHPTGHGVGLEIHEPLRLAATSGATLAAGHVVTVEPGVYLPEVGGARIEDTVEVTTSGCRRLTGSPLSLAVD